MYDKLVHRITIDGENYAIVKVSSGYRVGRNVLPDGSTRGLGVRSFASVKEAYDQIYCEAIQS
jgi:hypothetical protein